MTPEELKKKMNSLSKEEKEKLDDYTQLKEKMNSLSKEEKEKLDEYAEMMFKKLPLRVRLKIFFAMATSNPAYRKYFLWLDVVLLLMFVYWITGVIVRYFISI
jgi:hypothetical protein